jgi:hypothetical protein
MGHCCRVGLTCLVVLSAALTVVPATQAASVEIVSSAASEGVSAELVFEAAAGERNAVTLTATEGADNASGCCVWTAHDAGAVIVAGPLCVSIDPHTARCSPRTLERAVDEDVPDARARLGDLDDRLRVDDRTDGAVESVHADGGDGDDVIRSAAGFLDEISGGAGDDRLFGGGGFDDEIYGRSGNDRLFGGTQEDLLNGGGGHDELHGRRGDDTLDDGDRDAVSGLTAPGPDLIDGGGGHDRVSYEDRRAPVSVNLAVGTGNGERGEGDQLTSIEGVFGGRRDDRLIGSDRDNALWGGPGRDRLIGRGGADLLNGGIWMSCGAGKDLVLPDHPRSLISPGCELMTLYDSNDALSVDIAPNPASVAEWSARFRVDCPVSYIPNPPPCSGVLRLRRATGRHHPLLATGAFPPGPEEHRDASVTFTAFGHRLASRSGGVRATVSLNGPRFRSQPRWTVLLRVPR